MPGRQNVVGTKAALLAGAASLALLCACAKSRQQAVSVMQSPFTITKETMDGGDAAWFVQATNGIVIQILPDRITAYFANDTSMSLWYEPTNAILSSSLLDRPDESVRDSDVDGIPDLRILKNQGEWLKYAFLRGNWRPMRWVGEDLYATIDGADVRIVREAGRYIEAKEARDK